MEPNNLNISKSGEYDLNPFVRFAIYKPIQEIVVRLLVFSVILTIITVFVANRVPFSLEHYYIGGSEKASFLNRFIAENSAIHSFYIANHGIIAFLQPIFFITLSAIGLKLLTIKYKHLFKGKVRMLHLFLTTTIAYTFIFVSTALRLTSSGIKGEYLPQSLGSLSFYLGEYSKSGFIMNLVSSLDIFTILYCVFLAFGLYSYSKAKLIQTLALIFAIYLIVVTGKTIVITLLDIIAKI